MNRWFAALLLAFCCGCAGSIPETVVSFSPTTVPQLNDLPVPPSLPTRQISSYNYALSGAQFSTSVLAPQRVTVLGDEARFAPYWMEAHLMPGWQAAYALYEFLLLEPEGAGWLGSSWSNPPSANTLWLGLVDWQQCQWEWHNIEPDELLPISDFSPYLGPSGQLWVAVVILDVGEFDLSWLWFEGETGAPQIVEYDPLAGVTGTNVTFSAAVWGQPPLDYTWAFGGGATPDSSNEPAPTVVLGAVAAYSGTLTVANGAGEDSCAIDYEVLPWPGSLWIYPDPADYDWLGVTGSGTLPDSYIVASSIPSFNEDLELDFSLEANSAPNGSGLDINVGALTWSCMPPFIVVDPAWLTPGTFQANEFSTGYLYATTPSLVNSNYLYIDVELVPD